MMGDQKLSPTAGKQNMADQTIREVWARIGDGSRTVPREGGLTAVDTSCRILGGMRSSGQRARLTRVHI